MLDLTTHVTITCGATHPDPDVERRFQAIREQEGQQTGLYGGCGASLRWTAAYRCVECSRFMHHACLLEHFKLSGDDRPSVPHQEGAAVCGTCGGDVSADVARRTSGLLARFGAERTRAYADVARTALPAVLCATCFNTALSVSNAHLFAEGH